ncbi:MAG: ribonuclease III [Candidatus Moranbacteria bacterium]|jgi:ribonuclease-3|nr:ribonuclease III [Candidatus Moranbacteria bacterium]MDD5652070.1 ribonuclease III [Candidatus Moranbacteria bacterium]MDX9855607.1 ribonuclease III [Candidatus Moranbacteria bacterium]
MSIKDFSKKIGVDFKNIDLLKEAFTHRSYLNENRKKGMNHNERLEFLGDAVLELAVTDFLFSNYDNPEGELTSWRSALVNGDMLAGVSKNLGVEDYLLMSKGEAKDTGRARQYLLANALEAIIGAIYLDRGYKEAEKFIKKNIIANLDEVLKEKLYLDPKSYFQEKAQEFEKATPSYRVMSESGPDHDRSFVVGVFIGDEMIAEGEGPSKQEAQREAAREALRKKNWL